MKVTKTVLTVLLLGVCACALARRETLYNEHYIGPDENQPWEEQAVPMPAYPAGNEQCPWNRYTSGILHSCYQSTTGRSKFIYP